MDGGRADASGGVLGRDRRALTLGILVAIAAFAADGMGVVPALPTAVTELRGLPLFGWTFSGFMLAWLVGTVAAGQMADRRGPRRPMAIGLAAFGAGLVAAALARSMAQLLAARALQGAGGGAIIAAAYVAIARGYPDALRARMMALTASVWIVPALVGPAISGAIAERASWRFVFGGIAPFIALAAALVLPPLGRFVVVASGARAPSRLPAALGLALGAALVMAAPGLAASTGWGAAGAAAGAATGSSATGAGAAAAAGAGAAWLALVAAGAVAGGALALSSLRALLPRGTFAARRGLPAGLLLRGLLAVGFFGTEAFIPLGAGELLGASPTRAGLALTAGALGWIGASWTQDRLEASSGAAGRPLRVRLGFIALAVGIAVVGVTLVARLPLVLVPGGWALAGAGVGLAFGAVGLLCIAAAPEGREGEVSGQLQLIEALGTATGAGVGGAILAVAVRLGPSRRAAHTAIFALTLGAALLGALLAARSTPAPADDGAPPG